MQNSIFVSEVVKKDKIVCGEISFNSVPRGDVSYLQSTGNGSTENGRGLLDIH